MPPKKLPLPIDDLLPEALEHLRQTGALVLQAEPGAGKTTRVPPAILDAGLAELSGNKAGRIYVLQPRRVAARAAASRISYERGTELGQETGYQVRFERRVSAQTRIIVCTEGIFIRMLQDDPLLEDVAAVVFDEFHERSIDSDLSLAMVRQVRNELRPDLKIIVMSATLDSNPISSYLGGCPVVSSPGKTFPLQIEYLQFPSNEPIDKMVADGVKRMIGRSSGHLLAFLPGVGEIRQVQALLEPTAGSEDLLLMPLYGDMPLEDQQKVLEPGAKRKVVLATNVAETSITIDGVAAVVDSGMARVNKLDSRLGLNRLHLQRISRSSCDQRAGRAARTGPGICLRLWSEREQQMLADFDAPEISRVELSQCFLQLFAWGEQDISSFPWFDPPPRAAMDQALLLLDRLDALEHGKLTELGKRMALLPLQPRLARLVIEGERFGQTERAALCASLLAEREPFRRQNAPAVAQHHSDSDVLDRLSAIEDFAQSKIRDSSVGEILAGPAKQLLRASDQLVQILKGRNLNLNHSAEKSGVESDEAILRSLLAAFPDRVCKRREARGRRALMVGGRGVRLVDESAVDRGELFAAIELLDTGQSESLVRQASQVERDWLSKSHISTEIHTAFDREREKVMAFKRVMYCDLQIEETPVALPPDLDASSVLSESILNFYDVESLIDEDAIQYLARVRCLHDWLPELELPDFGDSPWKELVPEWCLGCTSISDLKSTSMASVIQSRLAPEQVEAVERDAPAKIEVPSGSRVKVIYEHGKQPIVAVRIQEIFGMRATPCLARSKVPVLLHLLAPNYRVQQITPDLASFWKNTYPDVKKELKRRYPKHAWPEDPLTAQAERRPQPKHRS